MPKAVVSGSIRHWLHNVFDQMLCCIRGTKRGDELLEVNGIPIMSRSTDEIVTMMVSV